MVSHLKSLVSWMILWKRKMIDLSLVSLGVWKKRRRMRNLELLKEVE